ncbi:MAG: nucleotidyltransferase [Actinomycetota bacterium]|nr:nucleotidyltransferase [Actinomycetota bacterium]
MTLMPDTPNTALEQLLGSTIDQLDISAADYQAAHDRYTDVGEHLRDEGGHIYVQGSILLGTVVAPHHRRGEYDLDLVCRFDIARESTTQAELKERVGSLLQDYIDEGNAVDGELPELSQGRRSWKLGYQRFHMDVLPAIPNDRSPSPTGICLTDQQLRHWQESDPMAYATWFRGRCQAQFDLERKELAKAAGSLAPVPDWQVRTPLHRTVQILKRHRDLHFDTDLDDRPPSSLITTLAGLAYAGQSGLVVATLEAVQRMGQNIENRDGTYWVENPVCPGENFADKWNDYPLRRVKFLHWLAAVEEDLEGLLHERNGAPAVHQRLGRAFGTDVVTKALQQIGTETRNLGDGGRLRVTSAGVLSTSVGVASQPKKFFGGPTAG